MDRQIFKILRKVCLFLFAGDIFVHALVGASAINGILKGSVSMGIMLVLLIILSRAGQGHKIRKNRKKRQENEQGISGF